MTATPNLLYYGDNRALNCVQQCGALQEVEVALRQAYALTKGSPKPLCPSSVVEKELKATGWIKTAAWADATRLDRNTSDSFDGWKTFSEGGGKRFGVAVEVEWPWQRVIGDLLKFSRAQDAGQIAVGIEVLYGPKALDYVFNHVYNLYRELIPEVQVVFCALDAPGLHERFPAASDKRRVYRMPNDAEDVRG